MARNVRVELKSAIARIPPGTERQMRRVIQETAEAIATQARDNIAVDTGATRESIRYEIMDEGLRAEIGTDSPVGLFLEFGTRPHPIDPVNAKFLVFEVAGETVFAKHVDHPGTSPQPWLLSAFEREKRRFERRVRSEVGGYLESVRV